MSERLGMMKTWTAICHFYSYENGNFGVDCGEHSVEERLEGHRVAFEAHDAVGNQLAVFLDERAEQQQNVWPLVTHFGQKLL